MKRRTSKCEQYEKYENMMKEKNNVSALKKNTFIQIVGRSTSGQKHTTTCVEYCLGVLVFENAGALEKIVPKCITGVIRRDLILKQATVVCDFLKYDYVCKVKESDDPAIHTVRALVELGDGIFDYNGDGSKCDNSLKSFQVIEDIRASVENLSTALSYLLTDCGNKFDLFMAQQPLFYVEQSVFAETDNCLQDKHPENVAIISIDYK